MTQFAIFPLPEAAVAVLDTAYNYTVATVKVLIWQLNEIPTTLLWKFHVLACSAFQGKGLNKWDFNS